jgi:arylesterase/paraoxonase
MKLLIAAGAATLVLIALAAYVLWGSGITRSIDRQFVGECRRVTGIIGAEDIAVHRESGIAYLSGIEPTSPGVFAYDLSAEDAAPVSILPDGFESLRPLGLSLWYGEPRDRLFIVDRRQPDPGIEIFELTAPFRLTHVRRVSDPLIRYPNDVVAVGPDAFYFSNTHASPSGSAMRWAETFLRLPTGDVTFVDGVQARVAASGIAYPNGVNVRSDLAVLYVASTATSEVQVYQREADGNLVRVRRIPTPGLADNIEVMDDGRLMVGIHPKALDAAAHLGDPTRPAPTRIVTLDPEAVGDAEIEIVYDDPGSEISAGATGVRWRDRLLIGPVREPFFLDCRVF